MSYTASGNIARIKTKGFVSTASSLMDPEVLEWLDDSLRSGVVPFLKAVRDEWFVSGSEDVTPDANARIPLPNSVASTIRLINWMNNGTPVPLARIEPENAFRYQGQNASNQPYGYMLKAYEIQILPTNVGSITVRIDFMERPADMVLDDDAAEITGISGSDITVSSVPLAWQDSAPDTLDAVSGDSPFNTIDSDFSLVSIASNVITISAFAAAQLSVGDWLTDVGTNPYPNIPIELHPLLQRMAITEYYVNTGDKRAELSMKLQTKLEQDLRRTLAPRTQGSSRPIVNPAAPGRSGYGTRWW